MKSDFGSLLEHYESLVHEYRADLERNLDLTSNAAKDPFSALDRINRFLVSEIARLKVQILDLDLKVAKLSGGASTSSIKPSLDALWPTMPIHTAGQTISIAAGISTHGFHFTEIAGGGFIHRWAGPTTRSGFVALIDRAKPLLAEVNNVKLIDPSVQFEQVTIDGETTKFKWENDSRLRFLIPALPATPRPAPTEISFLVSGCFVVSAVRPQFTDNRRVSFNMSGVALLENIDLL